VILPLLDASITLSQSIDQSINQSNQSSINQASKQSINQAINQIKSINQNQHSFNKRHVKTQANMCTNME